MRWGPGAEELFEYLRQDETEEFCEEVRSTAEALVERYYARKIVQRFHVRMAAETVNTWRKVRAAVQAWDSEWHLLDEEAEADLLRRVESVVT